MNPLSNDYHCLTQFKTNLSKRQKTAAIAAAIFASILPVFGTTAAFRKVVTHYQASNQTLMESWKRENFVMFPNGVGEGLIDPDLNTFKMIQKLNRVGITPENMAFERIWMKKLHMSGANTMFTIRDSLSYTDDIKAAFYDVIPKDKHLFLFVANDEEDRRRMRQLKDYESPKYILTIGELLGDDPLPKDFIELLRPKT